MKKLLLLTCLIPLVLACISSAAMAPDPAPAAAATSTAVLSASYVVTSDVLEVRSKPGEKSLHVDYLERGQVVTVYIVVKSPGEYCTAWARIGSARWVCADRLEFEKYP